MKPLHGLMRMHRRQVGIEPIEWRMINSGGPSEVGSYHRRVWSASQRRVRYEILAMVVLTIFDGVSFCGVVCMRIMECIPVDAMAQCVREPESTVSHVFTVAVRIRGVHTRPSCQFVLIMSVEQYLPLEWIFDSILSLLFGKIVTLVEVAIKYSSDVLVVRVCCSEP